MRLKSQVKRLKAQIDILVKALGHPETPLYAKIWLVVVVGYALSPLDLIPDFIPVFGYLDDLILIPLGLYVALKLIPDHVLEECREMADRPSGNAVMGRVGTGLIIALWVIGVGGIVWVLI